MTLYDLIADLRGLSCRAEAIAFSCAVSCVV